MPRVARQIEQKVDAVCADLRRSGSVVKSADVTPLVDQCFNAIGHWIAGQAGAIAIGG
jgi:hypothetical protein